MKNILNEPFDEEEIIIIKVSDFQAATKLIAIAIILFVLAGILLMILDFFALGIYLIIIPFMVFIVGALIFSGLGVFYGIKGIVYKLWKKIETS